MEEHQTCKLCRTYRINKFGKPYVRTKRTYTVCKYSARSADNQHTHTWAQCARRSFAASHARVRRSHSAATAASDERRALTRTRCISSHASMCARCALRVATPLSPPNIHPSCATNTHTSQPTQLTPDHPDHPPPNQPSA